MARDRSAPPEPHGSWGQRLAGACGPGYLAGVTFRVWLALLRENGVQVELARLPRAVSISMMSIFNSLISCRQRPSTSDTVTEARSPLFILGHWRSGTTHLHNLLASDERFIAPTLFQVLFPSTFMVTRAWLPKLLAPLLGPTRRVDNLPLDLNGPAEDEWALCALTGYSPYLSMIFPKQERRYDRYLTFREVSLVDRLRWRGALQHYVRLISAGTDSIPVLKSPPHTCRIKLLLQSFPNARFLHVHRNPIEVFQSSRNLLLGWHNRHHLQQRDLATIDDRIVRVYREMHESYFEARKLIPAGRWHEMGYSDLVEKPIDTLRAAYEALSLPPFENVPPGTGRYLGTTAAYRRNSYPALDSATIGRLSCEWARFFDELGYARPADRSL